MTKTVKVYQTLLFLTLFLFPLSTWAHTITIGSISEDPFEEMQIFAPFADYLAKSLQHDGIQNGKAVIAKSMQEISAYLREGRVDLYIDSPFPSIIVNQLSGSSFLLRRWKDGIKEYHSVLFTRKDSGISNLKDLKGKIIAFEEPYSSSSYMLPKITLMKEGFKLVQKSYFGAPVHPNEVGYVFSNDDENTMVWVLRKKVSVGAMNHHAFVKYAKSNLDKLRIILRTDSFPRHIVNYRKDLKPRLVGRIKDVLMTMDQSERGRKALKVFEETTKFDEMPSEVTTLLYKTKKLLISELK